MEDSLASLKLVKLKLANSLHFGDEILGQKKRINDIIKLASGDGIKQNLFAHASQSDKKTAIVTAGNLQTQLKDILEKAKAVSSSNQNTTQAVSLFELESNKEAIRKAREIAFEHALTVTNLRLSDDTLRPDVADKTLEKLDKWIDKMWRSAVAHNGLFIVLLSGSEDCPSGCAKIAIKRNVADVAAELPISI